MHTSRPTEKTGICACAKLYHRGPRRAGLAVWAMVAILPGWAADSLETRVALLERQLEALAGQNQVLRERLGTAGDTSAPVQIRPAGRETGISLGGLMQVQSEHGGAPDSRYHGINDRFQLRRMRLALAGSFAEAMAFKFETDFGNGAVANRTGASGQLTDAYIIWTRYRGFNLKAGQFKTPFGFEQLLPDPKTIFIERTLVNDRLTVGRQIGMQASGGIVPEVLDYAVGVFNGCGTNNGGNDNAKYMTAGRLVAQLYRREMGDQEVHWTAATHYFTSLDQGGFTGRREGIGVDSQLGWGPAQIGAELLRQEIHSFAGAPVASEGWYVFGAWNFSGHWQGVARYEAYDARTADPDAVTREWTVGLNWFLKGDDLKLSFNYQLGRPPVPQPRAGRLLSRIQVVF